MHVDGVGPRISRRPEPNAPASPTASEQAARRPEPKARVVQPVDTVELSKPAPAVPEVEADPVGLLPQLVVRMTDRLRAAFYDRLEGQPKVAAEGSGAAEALESAPETDDLAEHGEAGRQRDSMAEGGSSPAQPLASRPAGPAIERQR